MRAPPGPFRPAFWRSPLRGPWLTSVLGLLLLLLVTIVAVTGFLSHAAYQPDLAGNAIVDPTRDAPFISSIGWPTSPTWLYALTQGLHVTVGFVAIPLLLAKLWSVIPRLFAWPPAASAADAIERLGVALIVGGALFEFATGVVNAQVFYPFKFNFVVAHYWGAWVFTSALVLHVAVKTPTIVRALRTHGLRPLGQRLADTIPEEPRGDLVAPSPAAPTISRRGLLGLVGGGSLALLVATAGQSIGGPARSLAFLAPRRNPPGSGPNAFQVNKTAAAARITPAMTGPDWRLQLKTSRGTMSFSRTELLAMRQYSYDLPIACVEGWSTTQRWSGVRLADLAALAGAGGADCTVRSLQKAGVLRRATLAADQIGADKSLLALRVNGADLSADHGYPARIIVPALPGVHNTKWVAELDFLT